MFSEFKYIDVNLTTDPVNPGKTCVWFTIPIAVRNELNEKTGEEVKKYDYMFFPSTAIDEYDITFRTLDAPYYPQAYYGLSI